MFYAVGDKMEICAECHERDRKVIGCTKDLEDHVQWPRGFVGECDICGKNVPRTYCCSKYRDLLEKVASEE